MLLSFYQDVTYLKIPNRYTTAGTIFGLLFHTATGGLKGMAGSLLGFGLGFGLMLLFYAIGALGAGDVKLFGALGAITGWTFILNGVINSILFACVIGSLLMIVRGEWIERMKAAGALLFNMALLHDMNGPKRYKKKAATFPFMIAVLPAIAFTATYCEPLVWGGQS